MTTIEEEGSDTSLSDGTVNDAAEQTPKTLLNQSSLEATMRRAALRKELENLNRVLQAKEELASKMSMNDQHLEVMKAQFEVSVCLHTKAALVYVVPSTLGLIFRLNDWNINS